MVLIGVPVCLWSQEIEDLKKAVVKITAQVEGKAQVGTGFIVKLDKDAAYIVTAAHVVEGDPQPQVAFYPRANEYVSAQVLGMEGGDPRGLATLVVKGNIPDGLRAFAIDAKTTFRGGELVTVIGFPGEAATPWMMTTGTVGGRKGSDLTFSGIVGEGNSGGPLLLNNKVVGVITQMGSKVSYAVPIVSARFAIEGWGVQLSEGDATQLAKEIIGQDGAPMVLIPAGEFWMGSPDSEGDKDEHPRHQVYLDAFYMDKFEVTVSRYAEFMRSTNRSKPKYWDAVDTSKHGNLPVVEVDWHDADAYCRWAGKRLPTEAEWEKAARGTDERTYPWGDEQPSARLANFGKIVEAYVEAYDGGLTPVGNFEAGKSLYGIYDLAGNVWEWVADWYDESYDRRNMSRNPTGPSSGTTKVLRGGSWFDKSVLVRSANRDRYPPTVRYGLIGFRCAHDAPH